MQSEHQDLVQTVAQLRREVRVARRLAAAALVVPAIALGIAAQGVQPGGTVQDVVRARRVEIVVEVPTDSGTASKTVAQLGATGLEGMLTLTDAGGSAARLRALPGDLAVVGPTDDRFVVRSPSKSAKLGIALAPENNAKHGLLAGHLGDGRCFIRVSGARGSGSLEVAADGTSGVTLVSGDSKSEVKIGAAESGALAQFSTLNEQRILIQSDVDGSSGVYLSHPTSKLRAGKAVASVALESGASESGGGSIYVFNKSSDFVCTMTVDDHGNGEVGAFDREGNSRILKPGN